MKLNLKRLKFLIKTNIRRLISKKLLFSRPASFPFITGDGFRAAANFIYDDVFNFNPKAVGYGDVVFVRNDFLEEYFENVHPLINEPYVLVSHNEDRNIMEDCVKFIDDKILHWYGQNILFFHEKVTPLPIGLVSDKSLRPSCDVTSFKAIVDSQDREVRNNRIYSFFVYYDWQTERKAAHEALTACSFVDKMNALPHKEYFKLLTKYSFIGAPTGAGVDCHRTWEAIYLGVVPIVSRNKLVEAFERMGYPMIILNDWSELKNLDEASLSKLYADNKDKFNNPKLFLPYWFELFHSHRNKK